MNDTAARERLEKEKERLKALIHNLGEDAEAEENGGELNTLDQHPADAGSETFEREKDMAIVSNLEEQISEVEAALKRLEEGTYGTCEKCGKPIGDERLEVVPTARYCVEDQGAREAL
ncbi:MAG: DnaK suppressor protein [Actinomycetota bacterium]|jgi:RNA polymerase-binding transcription factor DksA|nr:DnaK suppressor protein [Actinomycetota bacterium]